MQFFGRQSEVPIVTAEQIRALQTDDNFKERFVVVDVRADKEVEVSIIPGAIKQAQFNRTKDDHDGKMVVAYCTVGYRSGIFVKQLLSEGWDAWNYQGSILDWCEHHFPVVTLEGVATNRVHTYDARYKLPSEYTAVY